jgi:hypothetical protein
MVWFHSHSAPDQLHALFTWAELANFRPGNQATQPFSDAAVKQIWLVQVAALDEQLLIDALRHAANTHIFQREALSGRPQPPCLLKPKNTFFCTWESRCPDLEQPATRHSTPSL